MDSATLAEQALQLLFKKLHPHLEDAAHALDTGGRPSGVRASGLLKLHLRLIKARLDVMGKLSDLVDGCDNPDLAEILDDLASNLTPVGENYQQSLTLTQLCLEEAPGDLVPFLPPGMATGTSWGERMTRFLAQIEEPAFQAKARWQAMDPDIGDTGED